MTDMLFTDYKGQVDEYVAAVGFLVPATEETVLLNMKRLAHRNGVSAAKCGMALVLLCGGKFTAGPKMGHASVEDAFVAKDPRVIRRETVTLTEAGEVALSQRDALRAADAGLGLPVSSPVASPEPLPALDTCSDDEPTPYQPAPLIVPHGLNEQQADVIKSDHSAFRKPTGQERKAPRK